MADAVHPRACERGLPASVGCLCHGSSPRLRGTGHVGGHEERHHRFIPAPAGNGCRVARHARRETVHPRACGERHVERPAVRRDAGSSPRLRGTVLLLFGNELRSRFIPAPAGNGSFQRFVTLGQAVHPRACGERCPPGPRANGNEGSSPRLRGTAPSNPANPLF